MSSDVVVSTACYAKSAAEFRLNGYLHALLQIVTKHFVDALGLGHADPVLDGLRATRDLLVNALYFERLAKPVRLAKLCVRNACVFETLTKDCIVYAWSRPERNAFANALRFLYADVRALETEQLANMANEFDSRTVTLSMDIAEAVVMPPDAREELFANFELVLQRTANAVFEFAL